MMDRTVHQAVRVGIKTVPVVSPPKPPRIRSEMKLTPDEIALALDMARSDRLEDEMQAYATRRRRPS